MEQITLVIKVNSIVVMDGKMKRAKLGYSGPGLEVYVKGAVPLKMRDAVHYQAMVQALARHIPLVAFRKQGAV